MSREDIFKAVEEIFRTIFDNDSLTITENTNASDIDDWDSLEHINLIVAMEDNFNLKFNIQEVSNFKNVGEMVNLIKGKME